MYRRDRVGSGSTVSSVVSSFTKKSREAAAVKEHVPSRVSREASFNSRDTYGQSRVNREPSFNSKESLNSRSNRETVSRKESTSSAKSKDSSIPASVVTKPQKESTLSHNGNHQDGSQSMIPQPVSRRESTTSSISSVDSESTTSSQATVNTSISPPKFVNPDQSGYVGFANLPNQVHRKSVKKGFEFTLMVVGESGLGKSTLVNSLFLTDLYPERHIPTAQEKVQQTVKIDASTVEIEERGVKLRLTVVDTPGFGDSLNSVDCFKPIIQYIDDQFERYLNDESGLNRRHIVDNRVHCCFYFINPSGHGLRPLDISFMRAVHHKVNIVPVIAKADTLTKKEVLNLKKRIMHQIEQYGISLYPLPDCDEDEDEDYREQCKQLKEAVPFAVVGSNTIIEVKGKKVRGRMYPWGVVEVENPEHCDFIKLRTMLITHMQDLQEVTQEVHYENFRAEKLKNGDLPAKKSSRAAPRGEVIDDKETALQEKEKELQRMQAMLAKMQAEMAAQKQASGSPSQQNGGVRSHNV